LENRQDYTKIVTKALANNQLLPNQAIQVQSVLGVQLANAQNNSNNSTGILPAVTSEQMQRLAANGTSFDKTATLNPFFVLEI
jgi:3-oxoacyl-[acyl-carrier-protein] synthase III